MRSSQYVYGGGLTWREYLQAREFETSLRENLSDNTSRIVASNAEIAAHIQKASTLVAGAIEELGAVFTWGFDQVLGALGAVNDSLADLRRIARTPSQTWAYEQFDIARDAFRRRLYPESLRHLRQAINGFGSNAGYELDFRFHHLEGTILMGSFENADATIVDPAAAERAFLTSARYAWSDSARDGIRAMVAASHAAYVQGNVDAALAHARHALSANEGLAEANYQMAKLLMHTDAPNDARGYISRALRADAPYALKMLSDGDFLRHRDVLVSCISEYRGHVSSRVEARVQLHQQSFLEIGAAATDPDLANEARQFSTPINTARTEKSLLGWLAAERAYDVRRNAVATRAGALAKTLEETATRTEVWAPPSGAYMAGWVGFFAIWNLTCRAAESGWQEPSGFNQLILLGMFALGGVAVFFLVAYLFHMPKVSRANALRQTAERLRSAAATIS